MHPRLLQFGFFAIPTSGALTAIGALLGLFLARTAAKPLDLDAEKVWDLGIAAILAALVAPRLLLIPMILHEFLQHPLWMLGVLHVRSRLAVLTGGALAIAVGLLYARFAGLPIRRALDALAPGLALAFAVSRLGDFAAGSAFGTPTDLPWGVTYTKRLASMWSGTPLGIALHPVQLYEAGIQGSLLVVLLWVVSRHRGAKGVPGMVPRDGEILGGWLFVTGLSSFLLAAVRGDLMAFHSASLMLSQVISSGMVVVGVALWL